MTIDWWEQEREKYKIFVSEAVIEEAETGDPDEITKRLNAIEGLSILTATIEAQRLTALLLQKGTLPMKAAIDAAHIAIATVHQMDYLLTWNLKHIANAHIRKLVERIFRAEGYDSPVICTPEELGELQ